ncbi:MAG: aldo/keto reductase [Actinomycetota bacterium]|nr:aldo/keto reductase [Actinomycetota bacterium]MDH4352740.1 aldo/keto reductase [Actinomycetota bacterium]MDH5277853.1 aldo/keto reductase [Actinomycetota bacterium]
MTSSPAPVTASGTFRIGGDLPVRRLGYGAMQLTGEGIWGPPADHDNAIAVLRRAVELGVDLIDTADAYGPVVNEELIREALHPYDGVVVATKAGLTRTGPGHWHPVGLPEYLKQQCELSLRRLGVDAIDLFQLHRIDARFPLAEQVGALRDLQEAGKIRHIGLSEVSASQLRAAREVATIATVQNLYNVSNRAAEPVLAACEADRIGFLPWFPVQAGTLARPEGPLDTVARRTGHSPAQLALAWLLARSPVVLPIPGTKSLAHLEENCAAAEVSLDAQTMAELAAMAPAGTDPEATGTSSRD